MLKIFKQYYPIRNVFFIFGEGFVIFTSVMLSCRLIMGMQAQPSDILLQLKISLITFTCLICLYLNDLYNFKVVNTFSELGIRLLQGIGASAIILSMIYFFFPEAIIYSGVFQLSAFFLVIFICSWRLGYTYIINNGIMNQKILLLGSGEISQIIEREIKANIDCGYTISHHSPENKSKSEKQPMSLCDTAKEIGVDKIVVAFTERRGNFPAEELLKCRVAGIDIIEGDSFYESLTGKLLVNHNKPAWLIFSSGFGQSWFTKLLKRLEDIIISSVFIILSFPVILLTMVLIKLESPGPVFYSQKRLGRNKKPYMVLKFRSMVNDAEKQSGPVWAQKKDPRVTRVGQFIRKWRIDEIPQIINVLKGDMSFVGPRPERKYFVDLLEKKIPYYTERFSVKPGLTGWAQVNYGYGDSMEDAIEKLNYELFYIKNMSIMMDLVIIFRTIRTVLFGVGAR